MTLEIPKWIMYAELAILGIAVTAGLIVAIMYWMSWIIKRRRIWSCFSLMITIRSTGVKNLTEYQLETLANGLREEQPGLFERAKRFFS